MRPLAADGKFSSIGDKIRLPDDVTMGYIAEHLLKTPLTVVEEFHSHLEPQRLIAATRGRVGAEAAVGIRSWDNEHELQNQISFSYGKYGEEMNVIAVEGFSDEEDPTR